MKPTGDR